MPGPREGFRDVPVVRTAGQPVALDFTPDGRMLVADKPGHLRVFRSDGTRLSAFDLSDKVCTGERNPGRQDERGLLGVTVDPYFKTTGYVYVYYTHKKFPNATNPCPYGDPKSPVNRVSRFKMSGNTIDPASEAVLIDNIPSTSGSHNAGDVKVGKDGNVYVSVGDGGCDYTQFQLSNCAGFNDAGQDPHALVGKILRVTRGGAIPSTNPYTGPDSERCGDFGDDGRTEAGKKCQEVFATGLRNPFRMAFDPDAQGTRFFINDVGQFAWEEIDLGKRGADYGWNFCEGRHDNPDRAGAANCMTAPFTPPVHEYNHDPQPDRSECRSITGGAFVPNDAAWPTPYTYLFGDYICNKIFALVPRKGGGFTRTVLATNLDDFGPISMDFGPFGSRKALYYTTFANGGEVRRIVYVG